VTFVAPYSSFRAIVRVTNPRLDSLRLPPSRHAQGATRPSMALEEVGAREAATGGGSQTRLLSGRRRNLTEGSNPSLSAKISKSTEAHTRVGAFLFCWVGAMFTGSRWRLPGFGLRRRENGVLRSAFRDAESS